MGERIYVSMEFGRSRGLSDEECEKNVKDAIEVGRRLIEMGHTPIIPHLYFYVHKGWDNSPSEEAWYFIVIAALEICQSIFMVPGRWKKSRGALRERNQAMIMTKKIYYFICHFFPFIII